MLFFAVVGAQQHLPRSLSLPLAMLCSAWVCCGWARRCARWCCARHCPAAASRSSPPRNWPAGAASPIRCSWASGLSWWPVHSQRLYELAKIDYREFTVSPRLLTLLGYPSSNPSPMPKSACRTSMASNRGKSPCTGRCRTPRGRHAAGGHHPVRQRSGVGQPDHPGGPARRRGHRDRPQNSRPPRVTQRACEDWREPDTFLQPPAFPRSRRAAGLHL